MGERDGFPFYRTDGVSELDYTEDGRVLERPFEKRV